MSQGNENPEFSNSIAQTVSFAEVVGEYFRTLMREGLTREEALALTINWQTVMLQSSFNAAQVIAAHKKKGNGK